MKRPYTFIVTASHMRDRFMDEVSSYITIISVSLHSCHFGVIAKVFAPFGLQVDIDMVGKLNAARRYGEERPFAIWGLFSISPLQYFKSLAS